MSIQRQLRRSTARQLGNPWPAAETPYRPLPDGGYLALHPTKGWRRFSARRLAAQATLRALAEKLATRRATA